MSSKNPFLKLVLPIFLYFTSLLLLLSFILFSNLDVQAAPVINNINPTSGDTAGGTAITINGSGFVAASEGSRDTTFGLGSGPSIGTVYAIAVQDDGKILVGGSFSSYDGVSSPGIARLNSNGSLDTSFNVGTGATDVRSIKIQDDGKILVGGIFTTFNGVTSNRITRLNSDGSLDTNFNTNLGTGANNFVFDIQLLPGGDILVSGAFNSFNSVAANQIVKIDSSGVIVDPGFSDEIVQAGSINTVAVQSDGKIVVSKGIDIVRLNSDGSIDNSFTQGQVQSGCCGAYVNKIKIDSTGKIVIVGYFVAYNSITKIDIVRLNSDGSIDNSFITVGSYSNIYDLIIQSDDKLLLAGDFNNLNSTNGINRIARLNTNGSIDTSFNVGTGASTGIFSLGIQEDGKVLLGGGIGNFDGVTVNRLIRLQGGLGISVTIGGAYATSVALVNSTTITAISPSGTTGFFDVILYNGDGLSTTLTNGFEYVSLYEECNNPANPNEACIKIQLTAGALTLNIVEDNVSYSDGNNNAITVNGSTATGAANLEIQDLTGQAAFSVVTSYSNLVDATNQDTFIYLADDVFEPINTFFSVLNTSYSTTGGPHNINDSQGTGTEFTKYESVQSIQTVTGLDQLGFSNDMNVLDKASGLDSGSGAYSLVQQGNIDIPGYGCYTSGAFFSGQEKCIAADSYQGQIVFKSV